MNVTTIGEASPIYTLSNVTITHPIILLALIYYPFSYFPELLCFASGFYVQSTSQRLFIQFCLCSVWKATIPLHETLGSRVIRLFHSALPFRKLMRDLLCLNPTCLRAGSCIGPHPFSARFRTKLLPVGSHRLPTRSSRTFSSRGDGPKVSLLLGHTLTLLSLSFEYLSFLNWSLIIFFLKESVHILNAWKKQGM